MPALADSDLKLSAAADNTTLTSKSFAAANGDVFVVKLSTWDTANGMAAPTGGGQAWQSVKVVAPGGFNGWCALYVCTVAGSPGSFTVASAPGTAGNTRHSMVVEKWTSAQLAVTPATNATASGSGAPSANIITVADGSAVSWVSVDVSSQDPAGRAYRLAASEDGIFDGHLGANSVHYFAATADVGLAGTYAMGMTAPAAQTWVLAGVEILAAAAASQPGRWGAVHI